MEPGENDVNRTDAEPAEASKGPSEGPQESTEKPWESASPPPARAGMTPEPYDDRPLQRRSSPLDVLRHVLSVVICLAATVVGYLGLDYASTRGLARAMATLQDKMVPGDALLGVAIGLGGLFVAAAIGRLSPVGPLVAGVLLGAVPMIWQLYRPLSFFKRVGDLPDLYHSTGLGLASFGLALFPAATALLLGTAVASAFHRRGKV